jgi:hypothetical protein
MKFDYIMPVNLEYKYPGQWKQDTFDIPKERPYESNPVVGTCIKCGMELRKVMWYVCQDNGCPVFPKVTF